MPTRTLLSTTHSDWKRQLAAGLWTATTLMAAVIVSRRLGGQIEWGLHPAAAASIVLLLTALNLLAALLMKSAASVSSDRNPVQPAANLAIVLLSVIPPLGLGVSLLPTASPGGWAALIGLSMICTLVLLSQRSVRLPTGVDHDRHRHALVDQVERERSSSADDQETDAVAVEFAENPQQNVSQSMSRTAEPDGGETIEGTVTLSLAAGQQVGAVHLPFCPPLAGRPKVNCHLLDDHPVRLRVTAAQSYGARIEAKRSGDASGEAQVAVGYVVTAAETTRRAA